MANYIKRKNSFQIRVCIGRNTDGKQIFKTTTFTPPEGTPPKKAEKLAAAYAVEFENKCRFLSQYDGTMRFSELADWYFENYSSEELKPVTVMNYKGAYKNHIKEYLGNKKLKEITPPLLTDFLKTMHKKDKLSALSCKKIYVVVQSIFKRGAEQGFIETNPCHNVVIPKDRNKTKKRYSLDEEETKRFITLVMDSDADEDVKRILMFLLYTGVRIGECLGLSWDDIDLENNYININQALSCADGVRYLDAPKTLSSIRTIGMNSTAKEILIKQKDYCKELRMILGKNYPHPEMIFPSGRGNFRDRSSVYHSLKCITAGTEFEDMTLHKLRHCNATILLNSGIDLKMVSEHLGHSDINITANIYADVLKSQKIKMAEVLELKLS